MSHFTVRSKKTTFLYNKKRWFLLYRTAFEVAKFDIITTENVEAD